MPEKAESPIPAGLRSLTPQLWFNGNCEDAIHFYQHAFGAGLVGEVAKGPDDMGVMHALLRIGDSAVMLADAMPGGAEEGPDGYATAGLWLYVESADAAFNKAVEAGCEVLSPLMDAFWGDRFGKLKDPFGHTWAVATCQWKMSPEEIEKGMQEWTEKMKQEA